MANKGDNNDSGFPFFEPDNYLGWLVHIKARLRDPDYPSGTAKVLFEERPKPPMDLTVDPPVPLPLTQAQARALQTEQSEWDKKDDICFSILMKALIRNPKTKRMVEAGKFLSTLSRL